jgi:radical SAM superfamily enzyme YgiQ (UPF0313 family)
MKLGLLAISGVRVCNQKLVDVGLTLPGFVHRSEVIASLPSLGLLTLAGMTPDDVDVEYVEVPNVGTSDTLPGEYDIVAISSFTAQIHDAYRLADRYRAAGTRVVLGGLHVSACPDEARSHADAIVIGEGEPSWESVLSDARCGTLKPVYDSRGREFDLADAPMPRFELLDPARYNRLTVQTQRGCPFRCEFCAASITITPRYKMKPVERVVAEIRHIKMIWPRPFIEFADDNTFVHKTHSKELLRAVAEENIRWFTETDVSVAEDDELLRLMRESGCAQVLVGFESTSFGALDGLETRANWKVKQLGKYADAVRKIQDHGVSVIGCFVLGLDHTGRDSFDRVFEFVQSSELHDVQVTILTPFPGTPLYERLRSSGRLLEETAWERCTLFDLNFTPDGMTATDLESGFRDLIARLYSDDLVAARRRGFRRRLREVKKRDH